MDKPAVVTRILARFEESIPETADSIGRACAYGDSETARRLAHSLKGAAANISAEPLRSAAERVEHSVKDEAGAETEDAVQQLRAELDRCLEEIVRLREEAGASQPEKGSDRGNTGS
jgi:HPt (histidine-containing phosphotransfer) domain-containing protein